MFYARSGGPVILRAVRGDVLGGELFGVRVASGARHRFSTACCVSGHICGPRQGCGTRWKPVPATEIVLQSGVALRFPPQSKAFGLRAAFQGLGTALAGIVFFMPEPCL